MALTSTPAAPTTFEGFSPAAIQFLVDLAANNERSWFQPRKAEFERLLKGPLEALCVALGETFARRGIPLSADPARSPFRIYRDVRFSKDKSPYKTHVAASFAVDRWRRPGRRRLLPPAARRDLRRRRQVAPGTGLGGRLADGSWRPIRPASMPRSTSRRSSRCSARSAATGSSASRPATRPTTPTPRCSRSRTSRSGGASPTPTRCRRTLPETIADAFAVATPVMRLLAELPVA